MLLLLVLTFHLLSHAQIDQNKLDSLRRSIDSTAHVHKNWQDSFARAQDSVYHTAISKTIRNDKRIGGQQENQVKRQRILQGILVALAIVVALVIVLLRKRRKKSV